MSDEARNVEILKNAYRHWHETKAGGINEWMAICDDEIRFGSIAEGGVRGAQFLTSYRSRAALSDYFASLVRDWEMIEYITNQYVAQGDHVIVLGSCAYKNRKTGKLVSTPKADSWRFANGKAVEFYKYYDTAQVQDASS
jgi:ketosteroid isomerase-like protein